MSNSTAPGSQATAGHRLDIDGLRAFAVLPVLAFHVGFSVVPGGFVGVDVFFVISGFLITQVLMQDIGGGHFSLMRFYERRVRRILPALLVVAAASFVVCCIYSLPGEFIDFSKSLIAAALSVSNVYFWQGGGYFATPASTRPLLHTWSLAVEEQFYIFWPLMLWFAATHMKRHLLRATVALIALSFIISAFGAFSYPDATFYLVHTRAWELLLGGVLVLGAFPKPLGQVARNTLAAIGLFLICASALLIHAEMPFPGLLALPPCLGTFLIILAGRDGTSVTGRFLSFRPFVFIGLISYSLYLWHWPLRVFQGDYALLVSGGSEKISKLVIIVASLVCATLSWRFIEQPFRFGRYRPNRPTLFRLAGAATCVVVALGVVAWVGNGFPSRYSSKQLKIGAMMFDDSVVDFWEHQGCLIFPTGPHELAPHCLAWDANKPNYLLLGDSHNSALWAGLHAAYPEINFVEAAATGCLPVVDHAPADPGLCTRPFDYMLKEYIPAHHIDMVVLTARWKSGSDARIADTLDWIRARSIPVTLFGPSPVYDSPLPRLVLTADRTHDPGLPDLHWDHGLVQMDAELSALASSHGARYVSVLQILCRDGHSCTQADPQGMPVYYDREHLTPGGSELLMKQVRAQGVWIPELKFRLNALAAAGGGK